MYIIRSYFVPMNYVFRCIAGENKRKWNENASNGFQFHEYIVVNTKFVSLSCMWAEIWLLLWYGGHIGGHLEKYNIVWIENVCIGFLVYECIVIDTKFVSLLCSWAEIWLLLWYGGHIGGHIGGHLEKLQYCLNWKCVHWIPGLWMHSNWH